MVLHGCALIRFPIPGMWRHDLADNKRGACLVTGAGDATGAAVARAFAREGSAACLNPEHIAANYVMLHRQPRTAWTFELDLRPWREKW